LKAIFTILILLGFAKQPFCQPITGTVLDDATGNPLEYVSIGIINTSSGTITNEYGKFNLILKDLSDRDTVRISMIGYRAQKFSLESLVNKGNLIKLFREPILLKEIIIKPSGVFKKIGTTTYTWHGGLCGWGGTDFGKGNEIGTKIDLGSRPVRLRSLSVRLAKQSFDSSFFRLHIRDIQNNLPNHELLNKNIIFCINKETGWVEIDLRKYNLIFQEETVISLEWIKVVGVNKNKLMKMNSSKQAMANVLFTIKRDQGCTFTRWGTEAKWIRHDNESPSFYLTIEQ